MHKTIIKGTALLHSSVRYQKRQVHSDLLPLLPLLSLHCSAVHKSGCSPLRMSRLWPLSLCGSSSPSQRPPRFSFSSRNYPRIKRGERKPPLFSQAFIALYVFFLARAPGSFFLSPPPLGTKRKERRSALRCEMRELKKESG